MNRTEWMLNSSLVRWKSVPEPLVEVNGPLDDEAVARFIDEWR